MEQRRGEGISEPVQCPACGHEVRQPEVVTSVDPLTGQAEPNEGARYHCRHCGLVFSLEEAREE